MTQQIVELQGVGESFRSADGTARTVLDCVDFHLAEGEIVALLGQSGSGKSILLRIMAGLLFLEHGLIKLIGFPGPGPETLPPMLLVAGLIETFGGLLLVLGLSSLPAAPAQALSCGSNNGYTCTGSSDQYAGGFSPGVGHGGFGGQHHGWGGGGGGGGGEGGGDGGGGGGGEEEGFGPEESGHHPHEGWGHEHHHHGFRR